MAYDVARKIVHGSGWDDLDDLQAQLEIALMAAYRAGQACPPPGVFKTARRMAHRDLRSGPQPANGQPAAAPQSPA